MTNKERAKSWMLERCRAELIGSRLNIGELDSNIDTDIESGLTCDCLDSLTKLLDEAEQRGVISNIVVS